MLKLSCKFDESKWSPWKTPLNFGTHCFNFLQCMLCCHCLPPGSLHSLGASAPLRAYSAGWLMQWSTRKFYQLARIMILAIFLYIAYVYNEIFTRPNVIFTCLGQVDVDFFSHIRSIPCNLSKLSLYMSNLNINFDIIGLSETWLNDSNKDVYCLNGYNHVSLVRPDHIHGGVSLFISALISYRILNEISILNKDVECLFVETELNGVKSYIGIIHRRPDADVPNFCDYLINILEKLKPQNLPCFLMWDYNIDLMKHTSHSHRISRSNVLKQFYSSHK